jgi:hypothetical protein
MVVSLDGRRFGDELYVLADKRSLGPPLPLPRGIAWTCMVLILARWLLASALARSHFHFDLLRSRFPRSFGKSRPDSAPSGLLSIETINQESTVPSPGIY